MADYQTQTPYRSLSQGANPYHDQPRQRPQGAFASPAAPPAAPAGPTAQPKPSTTPTVTAGLNYLGTLAPAPTGSTEALLGASARRGGGTGQTGKTIGSIAGGIAGNFIPIPIVGSMIGSTLGGLIGGAFGRKAASAPTDYGVADASNIIAQAYQEYYGKPAQPGDVQAVLAGQGLKPGSRWVGAQGLTSALASMKQNAAIQKEAEAAQAEQARVESLAQQGAQTTTSPNQLDFFSKMLYGIPQFGQGGQTAAMDPASIQSLMAYLRQPFTLASPQGGQ